MGNEAHKSWSDHTDEFFDEAVARRRAEVDELFRDMIPSVLARLFETAEKLGGLTPEAFEKRRREKREAHERLKLARIVFRNAVQAVALPGPEQDVWLERAVAALRRSRTKTERRAILLRTLEAFEGDSDVLRLDLAEADEAFSSEQLTDERLTRIVGKLSEKSAGATNRQAASVAAELSLTVAAFGDARRKNESMGKAIERIAKSFRKARDAQ